MLTPEDLRSATVARLLEVFSKRRMEHLESLAMPAMGERPQNDVYRTERLRGRLLELKELQALLMPAAPANDSAGNARGKEDWNR